LSRVIYYQYHEGKVYTNTLEYLYNENDDVIKLTRFDRNNNIIDEENITYVYDIKGNWIEKNSQGRDIIKTKTERNIDYK
jgi:hypothetical protein